MKVILGLIKYDLINILRGKFIYLILILYLFGMQQSIFYLNTGDIWDIQLSKYLTVGWLPFNLIMFPVMILGYIVGQNKSEIINSFNISESTKKISKILVVFFIDFLFIILGLLVVTIIATTTKVSVAYSIYYIGGYLINILLVTLTSSLVGLFIGDVLSNKTGDFLSLILMLIIFIILCNFYKGFKGILPLYYIDTFPQIFDLFSYDKKFFLHLIFWGIMNCLLLILWFGNNIDNFLGKVIKISSISICICLLIGSYLSNNKLEAVEYRIRHKSEIVDNNVKDGATFYSTTDNGYFINNYDMTIKLDETFKNICKIDFVINNNNITTLQFGLLQTLNIDSLKVNNEKSNYNRDGNSVEIELNKTLNTGDTVQIEVEYNGNLNAVWENQTQLFFMNKSRLFLGDAYEWYPKLNDATNKNYSIKFDYNGTNKVYSNLIKNSDGIYTGTDKEIFFISGNLTEKTYKDYLFVGDESAISSDRRCEGILQSAHIKEILESDSNNDKKVIIQTPIIPSKIKSEYKNTILN